MSIKDIISGIVASRAEKGGVKHIYYVACGGSYTAFYPAKAFLEKEAQTVSVGLYNSGEFIHNPPVALGENAIVVVASHKGNTPETIQVAALAQSRGVPVIGLTWVTDSPLVAHCDFVETYSFGDGKDIAQEKTLKGLISAVEILHQTEDYAHYDDFQDGLSKINRIVYRACEHLSKRAAAFAQEYKDDKVIYTMTSGAGYGAAYLQSICIFMEMQWIHSACIHSGEFFHGPFEITDANTPPSSSRRVRFLGAFGHDDAARHVRATLRELAIDTQRCRHYDGENGYARIRLNQGDREFVTSNKNGVLREHPLHLTPEDLDYIAQFDMAHSSLNGHLETELEKIKQRNITLSFDFSARGTDDYFKQVCPWVDYGFVSCGALTPDETQTKIRQLYDYGCRHIIATRGHEHVYYYSEKTRITWQPEYIEPVDTLGAGDAFLTGFMLSLLTAKQSEPNEDTVLRAMTAGGISTRHVLNHYGAFGFGKPYNKIHTGKHCCRIMPWVRKFYIYLVLILLIVWGNPLSKLVLVVRLKRYPVKPVNNFKNRVFTNRITK